MVVSELVKLWLQGKKGRGVRSLAKLTGCHFSQIYRFVNGQTVDSFALGKIIAWMFSNEKPVAAPQKANDKKTKSRSKRSLHRKN